MVILHGAVYSYVDDRILCQHWVNILACFVQVLENCSKVLEYFVGDAKSIRSRCLTARDTLVDKLVERYRHANTSFFEEVYCCSYSSIACDAVFRFLLVCILVVVEMAKQKQKNQFIRKNPIVNLKRAQCFN